MPQVRASEGPIDLKNETLTAVSPPRRPLARLALCLAALALPFPFAAHAQAKPAPVKAKAAPAVADAAGGFALPTLTQATVYTTAKGTDDRMRTGDTEQLEDFPQPEESSAFIMVDPTRRFQTILGFGGGFTDAAAETYAKLPDAKKSELMTAYFSPTKGLGYTLGRTSINSCDFSSDTYSYDDVAGDTSLSHFSIAHDLKYRVPFIKAAQAAAGGHLTLFASPWSPPAWMKTNGDMAHGGKLRPQDRQAWADYYVRFVRAYEKQGVPLWGLTVQNEPMSTQSWESCLYTARDEQSFVRDFLGPTLRAAGLSGVKLMIWDHNRGIMYQRAQAVYEDPATAQFVWGTAFHWYTGDHFDGPQAVHDAFPQKNLLFTEGSEGFTTDPAALWADGERYGQSVLLDLSHWSVGWSDWNLLLDEQGGPNHVGNFCTASVMADTATGALHFMPSYYYLGHFAKFIRPGARRIASTSTDDALLSVAFINPDDTVATVVLNLTDQPHFFRVWVAGKAVGASSPAHSIETVVLKP